MEKQSPRPEIALLLELVLDLKKEQNEIKKIAIENTVVLIEHERRSTASEVRLERLEKRDTMFNGFVKISASLAAIAGTVLALVAALKAVL